MTRVAAIDIGTNSVLLTVIDTGSYPERALLERATITRLGEGVDASGRLSRAAVARTLACLRDYARELDLVGVDALEVVGTSAVRDAGGGVELCSAAEQMLGVRPRVLTGLEEAELTFEGALSGLGIKGPVLVFDLGGGSTEIALGVSGASHPRAASLDIGCVRLRERHLHRDPPSPDEFESLRRDVRTALEAAPAPEPSTTLIGVGGTVTTLAALKLGQARFDAAAIHGQVLALAEVQELAERLGSLDLVTRRVMLGFDPARAEVIVSGALITLELLAFGRARDLVVSARGLRWGIIERLLRRRPTQLGV